MTHPAVLMYRRHLEALLVNSYANTPANAAASQATWDAMPLWLRARLCWQQSWIDAVYEVSPQVGRILCRRPIRYGLLAVLVWAGALAAAVLFIAAGLPFDIASMLAATGGGAVGGVITGHVLRN